MIERCGSAARAWDEAWEREGRDAAREAAMVAIEEAARAGARLVLQGGPDYPLSLLHLHQPPTFLFALGEDSMIRPPVAAIVGTRRSTPYGERATREIGGALARVGVSIISGLARGIDAAAHRSALAQAGRTAAVLGTGIDIAYPVAHRSLHRQIARDGLLLSEELPGTRATPGSFPKRNRIIAALADVVIVVEAGVKSGALITADHALELGRTVAAVPGPIDIPQSAGTNRLLRDGAHVIAEVADALQLFGLTAPRVREPELGSTSERAVWLALADGPLDVDTLATKATLPARECLAAVTALELAGAIECALTGEIRRR